MALKRRKKTRSASTVSTACLTACGGGLATSFSVPNPQHTSPQPLVARPFGAAASESCDVSSTSSHSSASSFCSGTAAVGLLALASVAAARRRSETSSAKRTMVRAMEVEEIRQAEAKAIADKIPFSMPSSPQEAFVQQAIAAAITSVTENPEMQTFMEDDGPRVSYVSRIVLDEDDISGDLVDDDGMPLVYNMEKLEAYWEQYPGELTNRWAEFLGVGVPYMSKIIGGFAAGNLEDQEEELAKQATKSIIELGPTFIKLGQVLSIRPDILPPITLAYLSTLQDAIPVFPDEEARQVIREDLGREVEEMFYDFSAKPIGAASLAQVYRAKIKEGPHQGTEVAVKVQRPGAQAMIAKDLYVMRKGAAVVTTLFKNFTANFTNYVALIEAFGEGLYTELDFRNESLNQIRMHKMLAERELLQSVKIPMIFEDYSTRRVMVSEWADGVKLTELEPHEIREMIEPSQEVFLTQLLDIGFFHGDPHPGNLMRDNESGTLILLDFGLVAEVPERDREGFVSAIIHIGTKNWEALVDDFVDLQFLPDDCDKQKVIAAMKRVLSPYLRGGGASAFNFSALSQDLFAATLEIPFKLPPYVTLLARSVATLEGVALAGNPRFQLVTEAYPFVVRKLLRAEGGGSTEVLRSLLFEEDGSVKAARLSTLLNAAVGVVEKEELSGFIDFDAVPSEQASQEEIIDFLLSPAANKLRPMMTKEISTVVDMVVRNVARRTYTTVKDALTPKVPFIGVSIPMPAAPAIPLMFGDSVRFILPLDILDGVFPKLDRKEELYMQDSAQITLALLGIESDPNSGVDVLGDFSMDSILKIVQAVFPPDEGTKDGKEGEDGKDAAKPNTELRDLLVQLGSGTGKSGATGQVLIREWVGDISTNLQRIWGERVGKM